MSAKRNYERESIPIVEAVETLSNLADLNPSQGIAVSEKRLLRFQNRNLAYRTIHWLKEHNEERVVDLVREIFKSVLLYVRKFYQQELKGQLTKRKVEEGIKDIILLVGEAAYKLDEIVKFFEIENIESFKELKEYQQLQNFYQRRIAKKPASKPLSSLFNFARDALMEQLHHSELRNITIKKKDINRIFIDFDSIRRDSDYELLMIHKQNGDRFYSNKLVRNLKLICEFGARVGYAGAGQKQDILKQLQFWVDRAVNTSAKVLLNQIQGHMEEFFRISLRFKDVPLVANMNYALMALMLSANPNNLVNHHPVKGCYNYFSDFQHYLRKNLESVEYQKMITYFEDEQKNRRGKNPQLQKVHLQIIKLMHVIVSCFYNGLKGDVELVPILHRLIEFSGSTRDLEEKVGADSLSNQLEMDYESLVKIFSLHSTDTLRNILRMVEKGKETFDVIMQKNLPSSLYDLNFKDQVTHFVRMGAPVQQKMIHKAHLNPEFLGMLQAYYLGKSDRTHLMINLQDRTSWYERARCLVLEELGDKDEGVGKVLTVVTLPTETDFSLQANEHAKEVQVDQFLEQVKENFVDAQMGTHIPKRLQSLLFTGFLEELISKVHEVFYSGRNVLSRNERVSFIRLVQIFVVLKLIESTQPDSFSFICKDGLDRSSTWNAQFYACMKLFLGQHIEPMGFDFLLQALYGATMMSRERAPLAEPFMQMIRTIKTVENAAEEQENLPKALKKHFSDLFDPGLWDTIEIIQ